MLAGITDPIAFLDHAGPDWDIACTVVEKALTMQHERRREELTAIIEAVGKSVGNRVAERIGQMFR